MLGGGRGMAIPIGGMGIGGVILMLVLYFVTGGLGGGGQPTSPSSGAAPAQPIDPASDPDRELVETVDIVMGDLQEFWGRTLGQRYRPARLVLFTDATETACGYGQSAMGPFYCPPDEKAYIDLSFYRDLERRFGAPGDFAQAYVLAHEIGHHVQNVLGIADEVRRTQAQRPGEANDLSVRMELMADCFAGVWGNSTSKRGIMEPGDVEEGLRAAAAIGDDRLQRQAGGRVAPESFTHGTSEQRARWLRTGLETGDYKKCDTFQARSL
jgi:predicted metalloprotease